MEDAYKTTMDYLYIRFDVLNHWRQFGVMCGLSTDTEIASFLLRHFRSGRVKTAPTNSSITMVLEKEEISKEDPVQTMDPEKMKNGRWQFCVVQTAEEDQAMNESRTHASDRQEQIRVSDPKVPAQQQDLTFVKTDDLAEENKSDDTGDDCVTEEQPEDEFMGLSVDFSSSSESEEECIGDKRPQKAVGQKGKRKGRGKVKHFACTDCDAIFTEKYRLQRHKKIHTLIPGKAPPVTCVICRKTFKWKGSLQAHMRSHTGKKPFQCRECDAAFCQPSELGEHMPTHENSLQFPKSYKCSECKSSFARLNRLTKHVWRHSLEKKYKCPHCDAAFTDSSNFAVHVRIHTGDKPFTCYECGAAFAQSGNLARHIRTHTGDKPYICTECGASFAESNHVTKHMRVHTGERPYLCQLCGTAFTESGSLTTHMRIHTGDKPYKCDICEKSFTRMSVLTIHKRIHTGYKPFICHECGASFSDASNFRRHKRKHVNGKLSFTFNVT
ncbi:zinc finger protein 501-like isoform X2 [Pomacea canaliculata]|uniref:zinc finger protein 501-like isoform X2 n=1 Tax=Pomacea canaliculata TaxID=400727 RepID=UPI000D728E22|nr:zinc finger protein 501-like isoform X2 [Pomacea canaliculata]